MPKTPHCPGSYAIALVSSLQSDPCLVPFLVCPSAQGAGRMHQQCPPPPLDVLAVSCARYHVLLTINVLLQLRLSLGTEIMVNCLSSDKTGMLPHLHGSFRRGSHLYPSSGSTSCSQGPNRSFSQDWNVFRDDSNEEDIRASSWWWFVRCVHSDFHVTSQTFSMAHFSWDHKAGSRKFCSLLAIFPSSTSYTGAFGHFCVLALPCLQWQVPSQKYCCK